MKPRQKAWLPAEYRARDVEAVKALATGTANDEQQKRALDWIINTAAGAYEMSFRSDGDGGDRETAFAEGRRYVGLQLVKMINMSGTVLTALRKSDER